MPIAVEVIARLHGALQRPFMLIAPNVSTHYEQLDRRFIQHPGMITFEPVIEPAKLQTHKVNLQINEGRRRTKTEVDLADRVDDSSMCPRPNQQLALAGLRCAAMFAHDFKASNGILQKDIV